MEQERSEIIDWMRQQTLLTPSDFTAAAGRWALIDCAPMVPQLLGTLREEYALKPGGSERAI